VPPAQTAQPTPQGWQPSQALLLLAVAAALQEMQ
jgi:hypothetical protein